MNMNQAGGGILVCIFVPKIIIVWHNFAKLLYHTVRRVQFFYAAWCRVHA